MVKEDGETLDEYKLRILWEERERSRIASNAHEPTTSIGAVISKIPDRWILWIALAIACANAGGDALAALGNILKGLK